MNAWHEGERALQARAGVAERMAELGQRVVRDHMPDQHRSFFAQLPFLLAGSLDDRGQPWASVLAATPGFAHSPDPRTLRVDALPLPGDPLADALAAGAPIGLLGIEPHTRRRNRMNGTVEELDARGFTVAVGQSFGNCPRYIQAREPAFVGDTGRGFEPPVAGLDARAERLVREADTLFIASAHPGAGHGSAPSQGIDVSHRGGRPGFVRLDAQGRLLVPDYAGNNFFNTLGNLAVNPAAGLLFVDFERGDLLQLAVRAEIVWEGPELAGFSGALRLMRLQVVQARFAPAALPLRFGPAELSPHLAALGA